MTIRSTFVILLAVIGCTGSCRTADSRVDRTPAATSAAEASDGDAVWNPHLLYLTGDPCRSLYVEVDAVEGCEPAGATLDALRAFLAEHCEKPEGIEIVRGTIIPKGAVKNMPLYRCALQYIDGPPGRAGAAPAAYMYVLFYDSDLTSPGVPPQRPYVDLRPYPCAIYMNTRYYRFAPQIEKEVLIHEAGHLLGLTRNVEHGRERHCVDGSCLMKPEIGVSVWRMIFKYKPPALQTEICAECRADLKDARLAAGDGNLRFEGPMLVRSEDPYEVMALPNSVSLRIGADPRIAWPRVRDAMIEYCDGQVEPSGTWGQFAATGKPAALRRAAEAAQHDPLSIVRELGRRMESELP